MTDRTVSECMTQKVYVVTPDTGLQSVARLCTRHHVSGAPVLDDSGAVVGVVTTYDLIDPDRRHSNKMGTGVAFSMHAGEREAVDFGPVTTPGLVSDVMTAFVRSVPHDTPLGEAIKLMTVDEIHRLVVLDDERRIVGMVTTMDIMRALVRH